MRDFYPRSSTSRVASGQRVVGTIFVDKVRFVVDLPDNPCLPFFLILILRQWFPRKLSNPTLKASAAGIAAVMAGTLNTVQYLRLVREGKITPGQAVEGIIKNTAAASADSAPKASYAPGMSTGMLVFNNSRILLIFLEPILSARSKDVFRFQLSALKLKAQVHERYVLLSPEHVGIPRSG